AEDGIRGLTVTGVQTCALPILNFHEFRSEAKRLLYQLRILRPINPLVIGALIDDLDSVGEVFGRSHDLYFLGERLRRDDGQPLQIGRASCRERGYVTEVAESKR